MGGGGGGWPQLWQCSAVDDLRRRWISGPRRLVMQ